MLCENLFYNEGNKFQQSFIWDKCSVLHWIWGCYFCRNKHSYIPTYKTN